MAAGGFREFVPGEVLDEDKINDFLMQGMLVFGGTAARGSAITSPVEGQFSFLTDTDTVEFYDGSAWVEFSSGLPEFRYVVVGGGGPGGDTTGNSAGGGGAGGYISNVSGELSGGSVTAGSALFLPPGTYPLVVGAGGAVATDAFAVVGSPTRFANTLAVGGGGGGIGGSTPAGNERGQAGGSGGGSAFNSDRTQPGGIGVPRQGFKGGDLVGTRATASGSGGGGAGAVGGEGSTSSPRVVGPGGAGISSSITGSSVTRAGGGAGEGFDAPAASGGAGGGGDSGVAGTANTGGGGGGGSRGGTSRVGGAGGSGVIIFKTATSVGITFSGGVTQTSATSGDDTIYTVTAAGPTDTFTIA
jgi:hypothetical protein